MPAACCLLQLLHDSNVFVFQLILSLFVENCAEVPRVDVLKEAHQFTLIADLPGFSKKDVDIKASRSFTDLPLKGNLYVVTCSDQQPCHLCGRESKGRCPYAQH